MVATLRVGQRVVFVGPLYQPIGENGPDEGRVGTVLAMEGYTSQRVGEDPVELVTVMFDGDDRPSVVGAVRIAPYAQQVDPDEIEDDGDDSDLEDEEVEDEEMEDDEMEDDEDEDDEDDEDE